uniref:Uncharacterized protein n=1 Tax=viral metagenome TaxID=1070528 RepID=A0A6C0I339_9ZZZZ
MFSYLPFVVTEGVTSNTSSITTIEKPKTPVFAQSSPLIPAVPPSDPTKDLGVETKVDKRHPIQYYVKASFMFSYIMLLTTASITIIEALRTDIPEVRHILNLETAISVIAGYFYSVFLTQIDEFGKRDEPVDWTDITKTRYVDWSITTPMMLFTLCIVLGHLSKMKVPLVTMVQIILLNYSMLAIGFMGEIKWLNVWTASFIGFIPFTVMFALVYMVFVAKSDSMYAQAFFWLYSSIWSLYGIVYLFGPEYKNLCFNILDLFAKCFIGLGLWVYYSNTVIL